MGEAMGQLVDEAKWSQQCAGLCEWATMSWLLLKVRQQGMRERDEGGGTGRGRWGVPPCQTPASCN